MGLVTGIGFMTAIGGIAFAILFFQEGQRLRRLFNRPYTAVFFYILAVVSVVFAVGGFLLGMAILKAFVF
ncbi:MAG: hypothetical protein HFF84_02105 [Oscillibacter sp.]|nr:hypothetical protein [Oscillibacter sp.]